MCPWTSVTDPDPGSGCLFDLWIRDRFNSRKYDLVCSSRIRMLIFYPSGSRRQQIPDPRHWFWVLCEDPAREVGPGLTTVVLRIHDILVCGSGSANPCLWLMDPDSDPDPSIFIIDLQDANKKLIWKHFLSSFTLFFKDKSQEEVTKQ